MRALVTGGAGFIGSHLAQTLLKDNHDVLVVDSLTDYYDPAEKRQNLAILSEYSNFKFVEHDLSTDCIHDIIDGREVIFHFAGQPGVRASWGNGFKLYVEWNINATQRLLEACITSKETHRIVASSSSSVYGEAGSDSVSENTLPRPVSPYGVTKYAAENLCTLYGTQFGLQTASLRYFTVFGPRQRPDMATEKMMRAIVSGDSFELFGNGTQIRDFTYVDDVVRANLLAATGSLEPGAVLNVGGGFPLSLTQLIQEIEELAGKKLRLVRSKRQPGDPHTTNSDCSLARTRLGWTPVTPLRKGLESQFECVLARAEV